MKKSVCLLATVLLLSACTRASNVPSISQPIHVENMKEEHQVSMETQSWTEDQTDLEPMVPPQETSQLVEVPVDKQPVYTTYSFLGDITTGDFVDDYIQSYGVDYPWGHVEDLLQGDTLTVANLEMSIGLSGSTNKPEGYSFLGKPESLEGLSNAGIDLVSIANNHSLDYGQDLFIEGLSTIEAYGLSHIGGGQNQEQAQKPYTLFLDDLTISIVAYNDIIPWSSWVATDESPGIASISQDSYDTIASQIADLKVSSDLVFLILHWGLEYETIPENWQIDMAHQLIDAGADGIIGHHPHVMQGVEVYKDKPILYSVGNFLFVKKNEDAGKTGVFQLSYTDTTLDRIDYHPVHISYAQAVLYEADSDIGQDYIGLLNERSAQFGVRFDGDGVYRVE